VQSFFKVFWLNKFVLNIFVISSLFFLSGCASGEKVQYLEDRIALMETNNRLEWESFSKKYTPQLRNELEKNLQRVLSDTNIIKNQKEQALKNSKTISLLLEETSSNLNIVKSRISDLEYQNVVREFRELRRGWEITLRRLDELITRSAEDARSAARSARVAEDEINSISRKIARFRRFSRHLDGMENHLEGLEQKYQAIAQKLQTMQKRLKKIEKSQHTHPKAVR